MKLYLVKLKGMKTSIGSACAHGVAYVVAENSDRAYKCVRDYVEGKDLGFRCDRELESIELIADENEYPGCGIRLYQSHNRAGA